MKNELLEFQEQLGRAIRLQRRKAGLSQVEVADRLGIPRTSYVYYEFGKICPDALTLRKIAKALKTDISTFAYPQNAQQNLVE